MSADDCRELAGWLRNHADKPTQAFYANQYRRIALVLENSAQKEGEMQRTIEFADAQLESARKALVRHL
jgi:hypothetical protein